MTTASELMTEAPATVWTTTKVRTAVDMLQTLDVRHLPVLDEAGELVGMLSDRDLRALQIPYVFAEEYVGQLRQALDAPVSTVMSGPVISVDQEDDASQIVALMLEHKIGAVPVIDVEGTLVGIVSYTDVLRTLAIDSAAE
jgi:CBS-domain-containing membrane protein